MNLLNKIIFLKNKKHLNNLYSKVLESKEEFKNFLIQHRPSNANLIMRNSLKSIHRVCEKIRGGNSPHNIFDVNGATYIFTSIEDLLKAKDYFAEMDCVVRIKDRISSPTKLGYRDILINVKLSNNFVAEVLLIPHTIFDVKMGEGHKLYEKTRSSLIKFFPKKKKVLEDLQRKLYNEAWLSFLKN